MGLQSQAYRFVLPWDFSPRHGADAYVVAAPFEEAPFGDAGGGDAVAVAAWALDPTSALPVPMSVDDSSARWQATQWLLPISRKAGISAVQRSMAMGQRVRKRQPHGGLIGLGTSPCNTMRCLRTVGSGL